MMHIGIVADHNLIAEPVQDKEGRPWPKHYVFIRKVWKANLSNPDPVTPHPIPVFINRQHKGATDWEPLPVGTRVLVSEVDKTPLNPEGLAVIAMGPQTDEIVDDTRETSYYRSWQDGGVDKVVPVDTDPVDGPNADHGHTHQDGEGMGYQTRMPYPDDPTRRQSVYKIPGITITLDHRTDDSTWVYTVEVAGSAVVYTLSLDAIAQTASLVDDKGNSVELNSASNVITATALAQILADAPAVDLGGEGGKQVARMGDTIEVTIPSGSSAGTYTGTITGGSAVVKAVD